MLLTFEERPSDSPFIERVWRSWSARAGSFLSIASTHCEVVVTRCKGEVFLTLRGPEKRATVAQCPSDGEWIAWEYPTYSNAETFVTRLARQGLIVRNPIVDRVLDGHPQPLSIRTGQRRFLQATGLTHRAVLQIERARPATNLLRQGASILDTAYEAGYFDQAHLTRSLRHFIGQTPGEIVQGSEQLSFLYKTAPRS